MLFVGLIPSVLVLTGSALADYSGPSYPAPTDLSSQQSFVSKAWKNATSTFQIWLNDTTSPPTSAQGVLKNMTFSTSMFSLHDSATTELEFHYTSPEIANSLNGTRKVDADSIYNIASVTKVFTVLAGLLNLNDSDWDRPLTEINPLFGDYAKQFPASEDPVNRVDWASVTPGSLAAQIAGLPRDYVPDPNGDLLEIYNEAKAANSSTAVDPITLGFPPLNVSDPFATTACSPIGISGACPADLFVKSVLGRAPSFEPYTSPGYADVGFGLLTLAISNLTGKNFEDIVRQDIFTPLGMTSSNDTNPPPSVWSRSVIVGDPYTAGFTSDPGLYAGSGGVTSTTNDLAKFGISILNSTLIPPVRTRQWLKPVSFTDRLEYAVGRPWEIFRYTHLSGHVTDVYAKSGDSGDYSSFFILLPEYDCGFSIIFAASNSLRSTVITVVTDIIIDNILPALEAQAGSEAASRFAGTYTSTTVGLNSSVTVVYNQTGSSPPGLTLSSWTSNSTNMLTSLSRYVGTTPFRLLPSIKNPVTGQQGFRLVGGSDAPSPQPAGKWLSAPGWAKGDWVLVDAILYGGVAPQLWEFAVDDKGNATLVNLPGLRTTLKRTN